MKKKIFVGSIVNTFKIKLEYNTYLYKGLTPGPIASPGKASIEAALYPEKNGYLYYVASGWQNLRGAFEKYTK